MPGESPFRALLLQPHPRLPPRPRSPNGRNSRSGRLGSPGFGQPCWKPISGPFPLSLRLAFVSSTCSRLSRNETLPVPTMKYPSESLSGTVPRAPQKPESISKREKGKKRKRFLGCCPTCVRLGSLTNSTSGSQPIPTHFWKTNMSPSLPPPEIN